MITNNYRKNLGKLLRQQRQSTKITLHELSAASGVSPSHLGRIEKGERFPSAAILQRIAPHLGLTEGEIFILAGFLSSTVPPKAVKEPCSPQNRLDPYVVEVLSKESVEVQRAVVSTLSLFKSVAANLSSSPAVTLEQVRRAR
jgi:transcriptional regulator with XRE-family HTH domain